MRPAIALAVLIVVVVAAPRLADPQTAMLLQAMRDLGPLGGWRCLNSAVYIYEPSHESHDAALVAEAPEAMVLQHAPEVEVDSVSINLRSGDSVIWSHTPIGDAGQTRRVFELSPGHLEAETYQLDEQTLTLCNSHLGDWKIVGDHDLG